MLAGKYISTKVTAPLATDGSETYRQSPIRVVIPRDVDDVIAAAVSPLQGARRAVLPRSGAAPGSQAEMLQCLQLISDFTNYMGSISRSSVSPHRSRTA